MVCNGQIYIKLVLYFFSVIDIQNDYSPKTALITEFKNTNTLFRLLFIANFREYQHLKTTQPYYIALSIVNAQIYIACVLFKHQCVVL